MPHSALHERAAESLEFIRDTMARSASFTAVPGRGGVAMGVVGIVASLAASRVSTPWVWLGVWLAAALVAAPIALVAMHVKARAHGVTLWAGSGRRFMQGFVPALAGGAILTWAIVQTGRFDLLPPAWLLAYGAGVLAGATASVPVLTWLGVGIMLLGAGASFTGQWGDLWLGAGFGALQIVFGIIISRKHGG
ncbi:MAG TPA: hypothetical protein VFB85_05685 [Vicinamibacterales bacterium]|nr:hypothetical protein [Vicinamibacterales bacterium]